MVTVTKFGAKIVPIAVPLVWKKNSESNIHFFQNEF